MQPQPQPRPQPQPQLDKAWYLQNRSIIINKNGTMSTIFLPPRTPCYPTVTALKVNTEQIANFISSLDTNTKVEFDKKIANTFISKIKAS